VRLRVCPWYAPAGAGDVHLVSHEVSAGAFVDAGGDRPAVAECGGVVQVRCQVGQVLRAGVGSVAVSFGQGGLVAVRRIAPATAVAWPRRASRALAATHASAAGSASRKKHQAAFQR
jgi:hypothetical protein